MGRPELTLEDEAAWELDMKHAGQENFTRRIEEARANGREVETPYGMRLVSESLTLVEQGLAEFMAAAETGRAGRKHSAVKYLKGANLSEVAFILARAVLNNIHGRRLLSSLAITVSGALEDHFRLSKFLDHDKDKYTVTMDQITGINDRARKRKVAVLMANRAGVVWDEWPKADRVTVGIKLIEIFTAQTGLMDVNLTYEDGNNQSYYVEPNAATVEWMAKVTQHFHDFLVADHLPTIIKPKAWDAAKGGGYWTPAIPTLKLVKVRGPRGKAYLAGLKDRDMSDVYKAVNAVQDTGYKVNLQVLEVMTTLLDRGGSVPGLPSEDNLSLPPKPFDIAENEEARKAWKKEAAKTYETNLARTSKRVQVQKVVSTAKKMAEYPAFYFPHQLDFRGRMYPVPAHLNPQGPDYTKALLTFATGKPIDDGVAAGWLGVHGANSMGKWNGVSLDKLPLEQRIEWAEREDIKAMVLATAADPIGNSDFWSQADNPWLFLAWVFDWAGFLQEGFGYISSLPVSLDGTCNGLQHYSAALRDEVGGVEVNLMPSDNPQDIYRRVAEVTTGKLRLLACQTGDADKAEMARKWLELGVSRSIAKRPVMTMPYGSSQFSVREFIDDALREKLEADARRLVVAEGISYKEAFAKVNPFATDAERDGLFHAALFLTPLVWQSIGEVVVKAREAMDWLKKAATLAASEGHPLSWTTPDGFPVLQAYPELTSRRIKTHLDGAIIQPRISEEGEEVDKRRQAQGIAPNWVHSMDATALRMYVTIGYDNGIDHFALVHDSYGTVAADAQLMSVVIREAFVTMYLDHDVLAEFRNEIAALLPADKLEELPPLPKHGKLDITEVRKSDFFFS